MKTTDYVKSRLWEKYKEYSKSGEGSSKCIQYIEGILKIPFSIYRKEPILCFLDEFRVLQTFINSYLQETKINGERFSFKILLKIMIYV